MPLVAAAVCPHPPLLVPEVAAGAAPELDDLRAACGAALEALRGAGPDRLVVVGGAADTGPLPPPFRASFAPWGVPLTIGDEGPALPLSLAVALWLLYREPQSPQPPRPPRPPRPVAGALALHAVASTAPPDDCARLGAELITQRERVALLVMADGSDRHGTAAPGSADPGADRYQATVARALREADTEALLALDPGLSARLGVAGRAPWQVLAGAVRAAGGDWRGELRYDAAPYGVGYLVAWWRPGPSGPPA